MLAESKKTLYARISHGWQLLGMLWRHRRTLARKHIDGTHTVKEPWDLDAHMWVQQGIKVLAFDYDGVLAAHDDIAWDARWADKMQQLLQDFPGPICVYSNQMTQARQDYLQTHYPQIQPVVMTQPKPHPQGFEWMAQAFKVPMNAIALVDDRLMTGMLAAHFAGAKGIYLSQALVAPWQKRHLKEWLFCAVRALEKGIVRLP